jgi:hypothetical protein
VARLRRLLQCRPRRTQARAAAPDSWRSEAEVRRGQNRSGQGGSLFVEGGSFRAESGVNDLGAPLLGSHIRDVGAELPQVAGRISHDRLAQPPPLVGSWIDELAPRHQRAINCVIDVIYEHQRHRHQRLAPRRRAIGDWFQCETDGNHCATHGKLGMADPAIRQSQAENLSRSEYASQPLNRCGRIWIAHVRDDSGIPLARIEHSRLCHTREQYPRSRRPLPLGRRTGGDAGTAA